MNLVTLLFLAAVCVLAAFLAIRFIGGNFMMIEDWKKAWRFYSVWAFAIVGILPDAYNAIVAAGLLGGADTPDALTWGMRFAAIGGILLRLVKQAQPKLPSG